MTSSLLVWSLAAPFALALGTTPQTDAIDPAPPTVIEQALVERACNTPALTISGDGDARQRCMDAQLSLLRAEYGVNLKRMSAAERSSLDTACRRLEVTHGKESYLDCLNARIVAMRTRRGAAPVMPAAADQAPVAPPTHAAPGPPAPAAVATTTASATTTAAAVAPQFSAFRLVQVGGGLLVTIALVAAVARYVAKDRRVDKTCRDCGGAISEAGDLCAACRRVAAESMRRAATERMEQVRAEEADRRRAIQLEEEERRQQAVRDEEARLREIEDAQFCEENARRQREEEARLNLAPVVAPAAAAAPPAVEEDGFDPYAVLGVSRDTSPDDLRAAYEQARSKYDHGSVAHLGVDVQEHFREKARAVDRAFQMLSR